MTGGGSDGVVTGFSGADADDFLEVGDEDFSVSDLAGTGDLDDRLDRHLDLIVGDNEFDFDFGEKIDGVLGTAVLLLVAFLPAEAADFGDRHSRESGFIEVFLDLFEFEMADDGFDFFHLLPRPVKFCLPVIEGKLSDRVLCHIPKHIEESPLIWKPSRNSMGKRFSTKKRIFRNPGIVSD